MNRSPIFTYILLFLVLSIILKLFGIINFSTSEIFGYAFIFYGISAVYSSLAAGNRLLVFIGTITFLFGIVLFLFSNYEFAHPGQLIIPAVVLSAGIGMAMVYMIDMSAKIFLILALIFILTGTVITASAGSVSLASFMASAYSILSKYWPVILIILGIFFIIKKEEKK